MMIVLLGGKPWVAERQGRSPPPFGAMITELSTFRVFEMGSHTASNPTSLCRE